MNKYIIIYRANGMTRLNVGHKDILKVIAILRCLLWEEVMEVM